MSRYVRGENEHNESGNNDKSSPEIVFARWKRNAIPKQGIVRGKSRIDDLKWRIMWHYVEYERFQKRIWGVASQIPCANSISLWQ